MQQDNKFKSAAFNTEEPERQIDKAQGPENKLLEKEGNNDKSLASEEL